MVAASPWRRLLTVLAAVLITAVTSLGAPVSAPASADTGCPTAAGSFASGAGTLASPWVISTKEQLQRLHDYSWLWSSGRYFTLSADIDMAGCVWSSGIGEGVADGFQGNLNGAGAVISNLSISAVNKQFVGLFTRITGSGATVRNLGFTGDVTATLTGSGQQTLKVGAFAGDITTYGVIEKSFATGDVSATVTASEMCIMMCNGNATANAGGFIGTVNWGSVTDSYATGDVVANLTTTGSSNPSALGANAYLGGFAGQIQSGYGELVKTYSTGTATATLTAPGTKTERLGGYTGDSAAEIFMSYWNTETSLKSRGVAALSYTHANPAGKTTTQMQTASTYAGWNIASGFDASKTWGVCGLVNGGLPFLTAFESASSCTTGPTISGLDTTTGSTLGGTSVVITGSGFTGASAVTFGGVNATSFTVDSATQITAVTPAGSAGAVDVVVTVSASTATSGTQFTYQRAAQTVTWAPTTAIATAQSPLTPSAAASALGSAAITYAVVGTPTTTTCTVDATSGQLTYTGTGTCTVRATAAQTSTYLVGTTDVTFTVTLSAQTVTWSPTTSITTTQSPLTPSAAASALGSAAISYAVRPGFTTSACSVDAGTGQLTYTGAGSCTIRASSAATSLYAAGFTDVVFSVSRTTPSLTWSPTLTSTVPVGSLTFAAASTSSDAAVTYELVSAGTTGCTVDSGARGLSFTGAGSCQVKAVVVETATYSAASTTVTFAIALAAQTVTWTPTSSLSASTGSTNLGVASTAGDGAITYSVTSAGSEGCTFATSSSPVLSYAGAGTCTVTATAAQTSAYAQGTSSTTVTITRSTPVLTWAPVTSLELPAATVTPSAPSNSGDGVISYAITSDTGAGCSVNTSSGALSYTGVGQCEVTASSAMTPRYTAASVAKTFTVGLGTQSISVSAGATSLTVGGSTTLSTTGSTGSGAVTYTVTSGVTICSVHSTTVDALSAGTCVITAAIAADATYQAASDSVTITVSAASSGGGSGGGGSGGGASPGGSTQADVVVSSSLTTPVNPAVQVSALPPIVPDAPPVVPPVNGGVASIGGREGSTTITEGRGRVEVRVDGTPVSFTLEHLPGSGVRVPTLNAFPTGVPTAFSAEGFRPGTTVTIYAMSTPVLVATAVTGASGTVDGFITLPTALGTGRHTLVVSGYLADGKALSSYVGIATRAAQSTLTRRVFFPVGSSALSYRMKVRLVRLVTAVRGRTPVTVTVGVVRAVNATQADQLLALQRARAVTDFLRAKGMPGRVTIGASIPTTLTTWAARRADVTVTLPAA